MDKRIKWLTNNGIEILSIDFSAIDNDEAISNLLDEMVKQIIETNKKVYYIANFQNTYLSSTIFSKIVNLVKTHSQLANKRAIIGITPGIKNTLATIFVNLAPNTKICKSFDEGLQFLTE